VKRAEMQKQRSPYSSVNAAVICGRGELNCTVEG